MIINVDGSATSTDIRTLIDMAKEKVFQKYGITLEEEITFVGRW